MRCPKCHYISFDSGERCRNCGYDFSLSVDTREDALDVEFGDLVEIIPDPPKSKANPKPKRGTNKTKNRKQ